MRAWFPSALLAGAALVLLFALEDMPNAQPWSPHYLQAKPGTAGELSQKPDSLAGITVAHTAVQE